jgi:hypothetical protein
MVSHWSIAALAAIYIFTVENYPLSPVCDHQGIICLSGNYYCLPVGVATLRSLGNGRLSGSPRRGALMWDIPRRKSHSAPLCWRTSTPLGLAPELSGQCFFE